MGIKNFNKLIPKNAITNINYSELRNKIILIDTSIYLYQIMASCKRCNPHIYGMYNFIYRFIYNGVTVIMLLDGKPPIEKQQTIINRSKYTKIHITEQMINDIIHLFNLMGIQYIQSNNETDFLASKLSKIPNIYGILSEDTDMFFHNIPIVLRKFSYKTNSLELVNTNLIMDILKISPIQLKYICLLSGSDYTSHTMSINAAYKNIHNYVPDENYLILIDTISKYVNDSLTESVNIKYFQLINYNIDQLSKYLILKCKFKSDTINNNSTKLFANNLQIMITD